MEWISVEDRLPEPSLLEQLDVHSDWILVHLIYGTITSSMFYHERRSWYFGTHTEPFEKVTHWMPLPKPPTERAP